MSIVIDQVKAYKVSIELMYNNRIAENRQDTMGKREEPATPYLCNHKKCCTFCWFSSPDQVEFEDEVAKCVGSMDVTLKSLQELFRSSKFGSNFEERFDHFLSSPIYRSCYDQSGKTVTIQLDCAKYMVTDLVSYSSQYAQRSGMNPVWIKKKAIISRRNSSSNTNGASHYSNCQEVLYRVPIVYDGGFYQLNDPLFDRNRNISSSGSIRSAVKPDRSRSIERHVRYTPSTQSVDHRRPALVRQPTGYIPRDHHTGPLPALSTRHRDRIPAHITSTGFYHPEMRADRDETDRVSVHSNFSYHGPDNQIPIILQPVEPAKTPSIRSQASSDTAPKSMNQIKEKIGPALHRALTGGARGYSNPALDSGVDNSHSFPRPVEQTAAKTGDMVSYYAARGIKYDPITRQII